MTATHRVERLDHVQLAMPPGGEDRATAFYEGVLGIPRVPKPPELAVRGGCWFERGGSGSTWGPRRTSGRRRRPIRRWLSPASRICALSSKPPGTRCAGPRTCPECPSSSCTTRSATASSWSPRDRDAAGRAVLADQVDVSRLALALPDVVAGEGQFGFGVTVRGKSSVYFTEPHYDGYRAVLVRLAAIEERELAELLTDAWLCTAPPALARQWEERLRSRHADPGDSPLSQRSSPPRP